ncbi:uncharacterized protein LOC134738946 isoform X2 [Pongo pygmaeus]|uniref:uncharacterized protein LOC134738946 isoform X2 n=1 Tax=Pongo pygmaeus TaxID=9600 RepID=UPI00300C9C0F
MEIILELQQSAQLHNREAGTQIDRQISQLVEGASGWQLWAFGCWTTIGKTEMEQGQKIAHFYSTQLLLFHDLQEFYWDNCPNNLQAFYPNEDRFLGKQRQADHEIRRSRPSWLTR